MVISKPDASVTAVNNRTDTDERSAGTFDEFNNLCNRTGISTIMSNLVSNVPAAMFLVRFLDPGGRSSGMSWPWQAPLPET